MCGIAGIVAGERVASPRVEAMLTALAHRGPDSHGVFAGDGVALGSTRLRVIDLTDAGRQPFVNESETVALVYNGEVYNYRELRRELEDRGHAFGSATDTEVLLRAYEEWGAGCLDRLNGMFAFALWDDARRRLLCARDRLGVKPFYYVQRAGEFLFASEIKALLQALPSTPPPDELAVAEYVARDYVDHTAHTFFDGIRQLPPGHLLLVEEGRVSLREWWSLPMEPTSPPDRDPADALRELFDDSVRLRLRSDVPIGSCLSGGLDSSSVVATVNEFLLHDGGADGVGHVQRTFSAVFPGEPFDESRFIDAVADANVVEPHKVAVGGDDILEAARSVLRTQDEPFGSTSIVAQWEVMRLARETGVTVLLDGQGGDELLGGYHAFVGYRLADLLRRGHAGTALRETRNFRANGLSWHALLRLAAVPWVPTGARAKLRTLDKGAGRALVPRLRTLRRDGPAPPAGLDWLSQERWRVYREGLPALLRYEDRNSMAFSIEARLPFLDYRLVELSFGLPPETLIRDGETKWLLRRALGHRLPASVRDRRDKIGFATPQSRWLRDAAQSVDRLVARPGFGGGYLDPDRVRQLVLRQRNSAGADYAVWRCLCFDLWLQEFQEAP